MLRALYWAFLGLAIIVITYRWVHLLGTRSQRVAGAITLSDSQETRFVNFSVSLACVIMLVRGFLGLPGVAIQLMRVATTVAYTGLATLAFKAYSLKTPLPVSLQAKRQLYLITLALVVFALPGGMLESVVLPLAILMIAYWHGQKRAPVRWIVAAGLVFMLLNAVKVEYRYTASEGGIKTRGQAYALWVKLATEVVSDTVQTWKDPLNTKVVEAMGNRLDLIHPLAYIIKMTPDAIPRIDGQTYEYLVTGWIPRVIWPTKPTAQEANLIYAERYLQLPAITMEASMFGIGHIAETYINFAILGFCLAMVGHGVFYGILSNLLNGSPRGCGRAVWLAVLLPFLNGVGSTVATCVNAAIQDCIATVMIIYLFSKSRKGHGDHSFK